MDFFIGLLIDVFPVQKRGSPGGHEDQGHPVHSALLCRQHPSQGDIQLHCVDNILLKVALCFTFYNTNRFIQMFFFARLEIPFSWATASAKARSAPTRNLAI